MKICRKCGENKPYEVFGKDSSTKDGLRRCCKGCQKKQWDAYHLLHKDRLAKEERERRSKDPQKIRARVRKSELKHKYGITPEQYDELLAGQEGVCAICKKSCPSGLRLAVDHVSGSEPPIVRGLLCCNCNRGIGLLQHSPEVCESAAKYLTR